MDHHVNHAKEITVGAISGMVGKIFEYPFDTVKVRLQSSSIFANSSALDVIKYTYANEGFFKGFYQGIGAPLGGACVENAVLFYTYSLSTVFAKKYIASEEYNRAGLPLGIKAACGGFSGFCVSFVLTPIELVKCKLQVANISSTGSSNSYLTMIRRIVKEEGIIGLWKGSGSTMLREISGTAVWFGTYEYSKSLFRSYRHKDQLSDFNLALSGALAGASFHLLAFPADTIKSNIQTADILDQNKNLTNLFKISKKIIGKPGGISNLYRGLPITLVRAIPSNAMIFFTYETLSRYF